MLRLPGPVGRGVMQAEQKRLVAPCGPAECC
jgi:hypothetical protein